MNVALCKYDVSDDMMTWFLDAADEVHLILDAFDAARDLPRSVLDRMASIHVVNSFDSLEGVVAVAADLRSAGVHLDAVASFTEFSQIGAAVLAQLLGVEHQSLQLAAATRDKRLMKSVASGHGVRAARFASLRGPEDPLRMRKAEAVGFPLVVKPAAGMGTMTTYRADGPGDLVHVLDGFVKRPEINSADLILEEHVAGEEYQVDAIWRGGDALHFTVNRYFAPRIQSLDPGALNGNVLVRQEDRPALYEKALALHRQINEAFGVVEGATHLEFFVSPGTGELVFSELATRLGGGGTIPTVRGALGLDLRELWVASVTGRPDLAPVARRDGFHSVGFINLAPTRPGVLHEWPDLEGLRAEEGVLEVNVMRSLGSIYSAEHPSEWCIILVVGADSEEDLVNRLEQLTVSYPVQVAETSPALLP